MKSGAKTIWTIAAIVIVLIDVAVTLTIYRSPIAENELSIYGTVPTAIWAILITFLTTGIILAVYGISIGDLKGAYYWKLGLLIILANSLIVILLPSLKGYAYSCGGDHMSHLGFVKDILVNKNISSSDVYPVTHLLIAHLATILNISPEIMMNCIGPTLYLVFIVFTYLLSQEILPRPAAMLATLSSTVLFSYFYNQVFPMGFAFMFFPLVLYLYLKYSRCHTASLAILLITTLVLMVFFHPVASFALATGLLLMEITKAFLNRELVGKMGREGRRLAQHQQVSLRIPLLSFIGLLTWIWFKQAVWDSATESVVSWFDSELLVKPMTAVAEESFNRLKLGMFEQVTLFAKMYGHFSIYALLSVASIAVMLRKGRNALLLNDERIILYAVFVLLVFTVWITDYVRPLTSLTSGRIIHLVPSLCPPLIGLGLWQLMIKTDHQNDSPRSCARAMNVKMRSALVAAIVVITSVVAVFSFYPDPLTYRPYWGVSHAEVAASNWLVDRSDRQQYATALDTAALVRFADAEHGQEFWDFALETGDTVVPDHFGYVENGTLGASFEHDTYLRLRERHSELLYEGIWASGNEFTLRDFARLRTDPSVARLYDNGQGQTFQIEGTVPRL